MFNCKKLKEARVKRSQQSIVDTMLDVFDFKLAILTYKKYEGGQTIPTVDFLWCFARITNKPLQYFFTEQPNLT
jgi:transcriptional regulator with XRE-family HTH domain